MLWNWSQNDITFDQNCWTFDGHNGCIEAPVIPPPSTGGSPGGVRRRKKYAPPIEDTIRDHERLDQILREDEEIIEFIKVILTKGLI